MPVCLGIRAEPSTLHWAVVEGTVDAPILRASGSVPCPKTFSEPGSLGWVRKQIVALIRQYSVEVVGLRTSEPIARGASMESARKRSRMEGVIMEAADTAGCGVVGGPLTTIGRLLGSEHPKQYLSKDEVRGLDWSKRPLLQREAILAGVSAIGSIR